MMPAEYGFKRDGETVTLTMSLDDYEHLLLCLGTAAGSVYEEHRRAFWARIALVNRLNVGNPEFTPYEIPPAEKGT